MKQTLVTKCFADSNLLLYAIGPDEVMAQRSNALIMQGPIISVQVLNEFLRIATRKFKMPMSAALIALTPIKLACEIVPLTLATHERATEIAERHRIQIFDANIVAAAQLADCDILYTEDLNHGQSIGRVAIVNPFV